MPSAFHEKSPVQKYFAEKGFFFTLKTTKIIIAVEFSQKSKPNRWPKSGPLAFKGVLLVAQKWPVGKQKVKSKDSEFMRFFSILSY